jgi:hypothetical protein
MGFMAGFGDSFSKSFAQSRQHSHEKAQDTFRVVYDDLKSKRETREAEKKEDAIHVRKAKALAESAGKPEAWTKAYEWSKGDLSNDEILENLQTGTFEEITPSAASTDSPAAPSAVDTQMQDSGIAPVSAPAASPAAPAPREELDTGNPITAFLRKKDGRGGDFRREQAIERIAKTTGASVDDVRAELDGTAPTVASVDSSKIKYTPGAMTKEPSKFDTITEAQVELDSAIESGDPRRIQNAERILKSVITAIDTEESIKAKHSGKGSALHRIVGPDGYETHANVYEDGEGKFRMGEDGKKTYLAPDQQALPVDDNEHKLLEDVRAELKTPFEELAVKKANVESTLQTVARMDDMVVKSQGRVLADLPANTVSWWDKLTKNVDVAIELAQSASSGGNAAATAYLEGAPVNKGDIDNKLSELRGLNEKLMTQDMNDLSVQKGIYETQKAIFTYQLAAAMGQDGKALSESERKIFAQLASVGTTPEKFRGAMSATLNNMVDSVDSQVRTIPGGSPSLGAYIDQYGAPPASATPPMMSDELNAADDPTIKEIWGWVRPQEKKTPSKTDGLTPASEGTVPGSPPVGTVKSFGGKNYVFKGGNHKQPQNWQAE